MVQWDDARLLARARGELSMRDVTITQQTTPLNSSNTGLYAQVTTVTPPGSRQEHLKQLQQAGVDATWIPDSVEHSSLYEDNILKLTSGSWMRLVVPSKGNSRVLHSLKLSNAGTRPFQAALYIAYCHNAVWALTQKRLLYEGL
ncbi:hypothetical protein ABBQ38_004195 [Trebouxia sp. C0009 RCD-2024]